MVLIQGGDLIKWDKASIGYYVGIDIAEGSVLFFPYIIMLDMDKSIIVVFMRNDVMKDNFDSAPHRISYISFLKHCHLFVAHDR